MPTREEIAAWLREAEDNAYEDARNFGMDSCEAKQVSEVWSNRAAQVEDMRCVECMKSKGPSVNAITFCNKFFVNFPHDHGCFHHEPKEKE